MAGKNWQQNNIKLIVLVNGNDWLNHYWLVVELVITATLVSTSNDKCWQVTSALDWDLLENYKGSDLKWLKRLVMDWQH